MFTIKVQNSYDKRRKENKFTKGTNQQEESHLCHLFTKLLLKMLCCPPLFSPTIQIYLPFLHKGFTPLGCS